MAATNPQENYLTTRWQSQRDYYSKQSARNKFRAQGIQLFIALGAVIVPVLLNISEVPTLIPTIISLLVAMAAAVENVYHFSDNWRSFRQNLEALKRERALFDAGVSPYTDRQTALTTFVERCENIIAQETGSYFAHNRDQPSTQLPTEVRR